MQEKNKQNKTKQKKRAKKRGHTPYVVGQIGENNVGSFFVFDPLRTGARAEETVRMGTVRGGLDLQQLARTRTRPRGRVGDTSHHTRARATLKQGSASLQCTYLFAKNTTKHTTHAIYFYLIHRF